MGKKTSNSGSKRSAAKTALVDPDDGKQTKKAKVTKSKQSISDKSPVTRSMKNTRATFMEDDEMVVMEINERNDELLGPPEEDNGVGEGSTVEEGNEEDISDVETCENNDEDSETETEEAEKANENENATMRKKNKKRQSMDSDATENVISFKERRMTGELSEEEDLDEEEIKSMSKFAKYLEKRGYIRQIGDGNAAEKLKMSKETTKQTNKRLNKTAVISTGTEKKGLSNTSNDKNKPNRLDFESISETTIYKGAIDLNKEANQSKLIPVVINAGKTNRLSSSSEEGDAIDTSDETLDQYEMPIEHNEAVVPLRNTEQDFILFKKFLDFRLQEERRSVEKEDQRRKKGKSGYRCVEDEQRPSTSQEGRGYASTEEDTTPEKLTQKERAKKLLQQAEEAKAVMCNVPGKNSLTLGEKPNHVVNHVDVLLSMLVDEEYDIVDNHVDDATRGKIVRGEYIDLAKLIPKDRVMVQQDNRMVQVNKDGVSYYEPAYEKESVTITGYNKWEQAFRVFTTIYVQEHPQKAKELMQYSHIIYTASLTYVWDNVYTYDIDFRLHISKNPERTWSIILNKAWNTRLNRKLQEGNNGNGNHSGNHQNGNNNNTNSANGGKIRKNCWRYNRGKCTYGFACKFEHKCGVCGKTGHGAPHL